MKNKPIPDVIYKYGISPDSANVTEERPHQRSVNLIIQNIICDITQGLVGRVCHQECLT